MKVLPVFILSIFCLSFYYPDQVSYWEIKFKSKVILDSREIKDFSFWDCHYLNIDSVSHMDTIEIHQHRCSVYPGAIETFYIVDKKSALITKEFKYMGLPHLKTTTLELFSNTNNSKEINIYHQVLGNQTQEPKRILNIQIKKP